jgi:hypothetical protein
VAAGMTEQLILMGAVLALFVLAYYWRFYT